MAWFTTDADGVTRFLPTAWTWPTWRRPPRRLPWTRAGRAAYLDRAADSEALQASARREYVASCGRLDRAVVEAVVGAEAVARGLPPALVAEDRARCLRALVDEAAEADAKAARLRAEAAILRAYAAATAAASKGRARSRWRSAACSPRRPTMRRRHVRRVAATATGPPPDESEPPPAARPARAGNLGRHDQRSFSERVGSIRAFNAGGIARRRSEPSNGNGRRGVTLGAVIEARSRLRAADQVQARYHARLTRRKIADRAVEAARMGCARGARTTCCC